jgi:hypothetical protein
MASLVTHWCVTSDIEHVTSDMKGFISVARLCIRQRLLDIAQPYLVPPGGTLKLGLLASRMSCAMLFCTCKHAAPALERCMAPNCTEVLCSHTAPASTAAAVPQYNISAREIFQSVLPTVKPASAPLECATYDPTARTRVWAYGTDAGGTSTHNWPSYTIEATVGMHYALLRGV